MDETTNPVNVEFICLPVINYAIQQNRISLIRQFTIENKTKEPLKDVQISISVEPDFATTSPYILDILPVGEKVRIDSLNLNLSSNYFVQLTERSAGTITVKISSNDNILFKEEYPIDVLAFDQWGGTSVLPEILSSFITPNHPSLIPIIKRASFILGHWTGDPSLDSYQSSNLDRPWKQMAAVYAAISELKITYSVVPSGFEEHGQRIRTVDTVISQKLGNCLDISLLYASCLEAIGINSLIVLTEGHAFAGAWLISETFPDSIIDDVSLLTKRTANGINEIALVETTGMCFGNQSDFSDAVKIANSKLLQPSDFVMALDVRRSRYAGIKPLPQRVYKGEQWELTDHKPFLDNTDQASPEKMTRYDLSNINKDIEITKQLLWERKLLDLSLRNNLLNMRMTKNNLQLISVDLDRFEDSLADGAEFQVMPRPTDWDHPLYESKLQERLSALDPITELIKSELKQKRLRSYFNDTELNRILLHLYRTSRVSLEENGANTLYLALGLLKWFETSNSVQPRYAPILLIPIEIVRKSAAKGYVIRSREEDTMMNITLLEMLRQNFGINIPGLDPLPTDDSGVDVRLIYSIIRNSIKNQPKWDVEEQAVLGIFSFNKFIMWNDIRNNSHKLADNKLVLSLMNGKIEWDIDDDMADASVLDKELSAADVVLPISADSSQLEAVYEAVNDKTYILHGPPGTGKSQTITNIIANALYRGKRVLFVAEKMAALSVVQSRLSNIGLAPFCLELHSNKTKKSAVLAQLKETTEIVKRSSPENFKTEAMRLNNLRAELNTYIDALHKKYSFGLSLYDAVTRYLSIDNNSVFVIPQALLENLTDSTIVEWQDAIETLVSTGKACGHPYNHPLTGIKIQHYSAAVKDEASNILSKTINLLDNINIKISAVSALLGSSACNKEQTGILPGIINILLRIPELTPTLLTQPRSNEVLDEYREITTHGRERDAIKKEIKTKYTDDILPINAKLLLTEWNQFSDKWILPRFFGQRKIKKQLKGHSLSGSVLSDEVKGILNQVIRYQEEESYINGYADKLSAFFGRFGRKNNEDWATIGQIIDDTGILNGLILKYSKDITNTANTKEALSKYLTEGIDSFRSIYAGSLSELNNLISQLPLNEDQLHSSLGIYIGALYDNSDEWTDNAVSQLKLWLDNIDKLKDWYQWLQVSEKLEKLNIGFVAGDYKIKNIPTEEVFDSFNKSLYQAIIEYIISKEPSLALFKGKLFDDIIQKYKTLAANFEELTKKELYAKLASNIPSFTKEAAQNSEVGILQRNIRNNGRGMPIRKLFDQIPTLLSRMCPCMLMSPISVAQYIDPEADKFDLIVFDEASQMPTYEAIGAIARGKNIVIVGDPKQMPPTNFFNANTVDEDNLDMEDLESILDDCLALSIPSKHLLWHYRSKHESLIAFSNSEYYGNKLFTFPSPDNIESKVKIVPVKGFYDKGKSRQNKVEAQAVIDEIARRLSDPVLRKKSIGVVTFSSVQQTLIEDLLSDLFIFRSDLESFAMECKEPLFIKNLENVQGDERDVILFSVGYGPDIEGRVSMNFGPLNRLGGERRLNVAVSRARNEMIIFSTLRSDQIDLNRTSAIGVAGLKRFLEYAEKGERITSNMQINTPATDSIERFIAKELNKLGYSTHTNIGTSGYKIDIGIVDKNNPSSYILGILCDGENYKDTKTARDREIVQNGVLKGLGWNICKVWTMDWWENPQEVIETIVKAISEAEENKEEEDVPVSNIAETEITETVTSEIPPIIILEEATQSDKQEQIEEKQYIPAEITPSNYPPESFLFPEHRSLILSQIKEIIEAEAPVSRSLICRKILSAWGISRLGVRIEGYFDMLFGMLSYYRIKHEDLTFFWLDKEQCTSYSIYRPISGRDATDLPPEEVANALKQILTEQISLPAKDLSKLGAQLFGFARSGTNVEAAMSRGMKEAVKRGYIKSENGRVIIK